MIIALFTTENRPLWRRKCKTATHKVRTCILKDEETSLNISQSFYILLICIRLIFVQKKNQSLNSLNTSPFKNNLISTFIVWWIPTEIWIFDLLKIIINYKPRVRKLSTQGNKNSSCGSKIYYYLCIKKTTDLLIKILLQVQCICRW